MTVECGETALAELIEEWWRRAELDEELRHLAEVDRVQMELRANERPIGRHLVWERPRSNGRERRWTVRLGLGPDDVGLLAGQGLEPAALLWAGRLVVTGPASARSVVEVLPSAQDATRATGLAMPPLGLLSWPADVDPPPEALARGFARWATAIEQAHALCVPSAPHRSVVTLECPVAHREPPLTARVCEPRRAPAGRAGTTVRILWSSGRALWASFAGQLTLADALLTGMCRVEGDVEAFLRLVNPRRVPSREG